MSHDTENTTHAGTGPVDRPVGGRLCCSFCGRDDEAAAVIIKGINGARICDECIDLCRDILGAHRLAPSSVPPELTAGGKPNT